MVSPRHILALRFAGIAAFFGLLACASVPVALAQGGSPVQPEYTGQPVPAGPSVNEFTGDFTYGLPVLTVPGPHGSSYSLTLSYQAGTNPNSDVSWVGYGWSLNPGAVVRGKRGFPDDWDDTVTYHAKRPVDYTVSSEGSITAEISSGDLKNLPLLEELDLIAGIQRTIRYDSRTGFGDLLGLSAGVSFVGNYAGAQFMNENGEHSWSGVVSPNLLSSLAYVLSPTKSNTDPGKTKIEPFSFSALWKGTKSAAMSRLTGSGGMPFVFSSREFELAPPISLELTGKSTTFGHQTTISVSPGVVIGATIGTSMNVLHVQPRPQQRFPAFGYMRSVAAEGIDRALTDYYYEKDVPFVMDDKFLPIPFSNADVFSVTGGGNFRLFNRNAGGFHQNTVSSKIDVLNVESAIDVGTLFGLGGRFGIGSINYDARAWKNSIALDHHSFTDEGDEPWFFRFSHDMGGSLLYDNNDDPVRAWLTERSGFLEWAVDQLRINDVDRVPLLPGDIRLYQEDWERPGRSGYVGFTLNKDMLLQKNDNYYKSYARGTQVTAFISDRNSMPDQIGEFALFGPGNSRYIYSLPVYVRNERSMNLGLRNFRLDSAGNLKHNLVAYRYLDEGSAPTAVGEEMKGPYAVAWLLTAITTPDYVDLTGDGPSDDDLGGWTRFHYVRQSGSSQKSDVSTNSWMYWRTPYNGLAYNPGELSDPEDDLGGYSEGWKEAYYPWVIETRTHMALFRLNDVYTPRKDGYAQRDDLGRSRLAGDSTVSGARYQGSTSNPEYNDARYLDRIELYTKGEDGNPDSLLSIVHFEYDYSLRPNMPNSLPVHPDSATRYGMLTLRKVWTESLNVRNNRIAPVVFGYEYRRSGDYAANVQARYPGITSFADGLTSAQENPRYSMYDFDAWGNYRPGGATRLDLRFPWVPQNDTSTWDPAAWQLKWIKSPTGGEMQIQYEEDEYSFVHDRPAMAMVSLVETAGEGFGEQSADMDNDNTYFLRLSDLGVDSTDYAQVAQLRQLIERYGKKEKKVFFKFFYALKGNDTDFEYPEYNSEYIEGYADLDTVVLQEMDGGAWYTIYVKLIGWEKDDPGVPHNHGLPKKVCLDFVHKNKRGKLAPYENVPYSSNRDIMGANLQAHFYGFDEDDYCKDLDYARSYIRVPMLTPKKGGGLRVKRLLSYDPGIEGDSALYGTEYHYEVYDQERNRVISSGVAANEPGTARDENPLVAYNAREEDEKTYGKVMAGRDRARNEGPLGETLLPAASVGYSRVATSPIHQGATTVGFGVTDFHTYRDYPFDARYEATGNAVGYTEVGGDDFRTLPLFSNFIFYRQDENLIYRTQGYRFVLTDMHGKVRRRLSNGGPYTPLESDWITGAMTEYSYFQPGDSIPLLYRVGDSIRYGYPGKVMEVVHASRRNGAYIDDWKVEGDVGIWFGSGMGYYAVNNSELSTHVITKVVNYPAIVKGVTSYADGNYNYVENVAFDPRSGTPLVTRARDAFDGLALDESPGGHVGTYIGYSFPVVHVHPEFDQASGNERGLIRSTGGFEIVKKKDGAGTPYLVFPAKYATRWLRKLTPGDFIELRAADDDEDAGRYHVDFIDENIVWLLPSGLYNTASDPALSFLNEAVNIEIVHSGRENAPGAGIGGVATYGETDAEVATGANFGWSGPGAAARLAFVEQLNDALALGSGSFDSSNVDTSLYFKLPTTGSCGNLEDLGETFELLVDVDTIFIASPDLSTGIYVDTIVTLGSGGWFALNDAGQVVFRSQGHLPTLDRWRSRPGEEQRVWNFTFCGDNPAYRSVAGVIGASASGRMNDTNDYNGGGLDAGAGAPNAYETGERGRWMPRTAYAYRTGITGGSRPIAGERVYKNAGVFDDFTLFNWGEPKSSDMSGWFRLDTVTRINRHNIPYGGLDMLGHPSVTLFDYGPDRDLLPILTAWNADTGTVAFESFELYQDGSYSGDITADRAHSGKLSLTTEGNGFPIYLTATEHVLEKGLLIRFWMYPLWKDEVDLRFITSGSPATFSVTGAHRIARAGEWALYEYHIDSLALAPLYSVDEELTILFVRADEGDTIRIDDVKIQPTDGVAAGYVFDKRTFRPVAMFDDQNFGAYPQYDAEGKAIRTIVETSRGIRTVAESHVHIPGADRDWLGEGAPFTPSTILGSGTPTSLFDQATDRGGNGKEGTRFDALNLELGLDRQSVKVFGVEPGRLRDLVQEKAGEFNALSPTELDLLKRYEALNARHAELQKAKESAATEDARGALEEQIKGLETERDELLRQLGITAQ